MQEVQAQSLGQEDPLEKENGNPLQYSCLENPMDGGAWQSTVHEFSKSWTWLSDFTDVQYVYERGFWEESVFALGKRQDINIWIV